MFIVAKNTIYQINVAVWKLKIWNMCFNILFFFRHLNEKLLPMKNFDNFPLTKSQFSNNTYVYPLNDILRIFSCKMRLNEVSVLSNYNN